MSKATSKATTSTAAKVSEKAIASVKSAALAYASAKTAEDAAAISSEQKLIVLRKAIVDAKFPTKEDAKAVIEPLLVDCFTKAKKPDAKKYAGEQCSRVLGLCFRDAAELAQVEQGIAAKLPVNSLIGLSTGRLKLVAPKKGAKDQTPKLVEVKRDKRGGSNAVSPLESFTKAVNDATTAASTAKLGALELFNALIDACKACELIDEDEADTISEAITDAL